MMAPPITPPAAKALTLPRRDTSLEIVIAEILAPATANPRMKTE